MSDPANRTARCAELLSTLVALDTANPMGGPCARETPIERQAIAVIERLFAPHAGKLSMVRQQCSPIHDHAGSGCGWLAGRDQRHRWGLGRG